MSQKVKMATQKVSYFNTETDSLIEIMLSEADARRAENDLHFATALMNTAMQQEQEQLHINGDSTPTDLESESRVDDSEKGSLYRWTTPCVMLLLDRYKAMEDKLTNGKQSQKKVWEQISKSLIEKGYKVTGPQCAAKLRSLKKSYKSVKDHNNKSGNDRRTWQFYDITFSKKKSWVAPVALASSSGLSKKVDIERSESTCDEPSTSTTPSKTNVLLLKRLRQREEIEQNKAKRHKERMEMDAKLLAVLEKLANKD